MKYRRKESLTPDSLCPCGTSKQINNCHLGPDGHFKVARPVVAPRAPKTGFAHPRCYLRTTCDCSTKISAEHYFSKNILNQIGVGFVVDGTFFGKPGTALSLTEKSLTAKILCERHNNNLSPLDIEAGRLFQFLRNALQDRERRTSTQKQVVELISGDAIELWMLKLACGLYFSIAMSEGEKLSLTHSIDMNRVVAALFDGRWDHRAGLYVCPMPGGVFSTSENLAMVAPLSDNIARNFCGVRASFHGFWFDLLFDTRGANPLPWDDITWHPLVICFDYEVRPHRIYFSWPVGAVGNPIVLSTKPPTTENVESFRRRMKNRRI